MENTQAVSLIIAAFIIALFMIPVVYIIFIYDRDKPIQYTIEEINVIIFKLIKMKRCCIDEQERNEYQKTIDYYIGIRDDMMKKESEKKPEKKIPDMKG